jgi:phage tail-like protein
LDVADARTADPPFGARFVLSVDGVQIGAFTEISGLAVTIDVEELAEGGQNQFTHKLLGRMKWPNLVLKRGVTDTDALFEWLARCSGDGFTGAGNRVDGKNGEVQVLSSQGSPVRSWHFTNAKPVRWTGPRLAASSNELAVEELEVCHNGFQPQK